MQYRIIYGATNFVNTDLVNSSFDELTQRALSTVATLALSAIRLIAVAW